MRAKEPLTILFALPFAPDLQGTHGGSRATAAIVNMLSKRHRVHVLYLARAGDPEPRQPPGGCIAIERVDAEAPQAQSSSLPSGIALKAARLLWRNPQWVDHAWSSRFARRAGEVAREIQPDLVHYEFHVMAQYLPLIRAACPTALHIVTEHEPGIKAEERQGGSQRFKEKARAFAKSLAWRRFERRILPQAEAIVVFTESDAAKLRRLLKSQAPPINVIPFRLPHDFSPAAATESPVQSDFVFVGNFRHPPNVDAALRLVGDIFPLIQERLHAATLKIVGVDPPPELISAASETVEITGRVDDPAVYLAGASVVLVPLRQGGGLRVKMVEACAAGKAIIASPLAVEGLGLSDRREFILADTDEDFAGNAVSLLKDSNLRKSLEQASRAWFEREQGEERWKEEYDSLYGELFARHPTRQGLKGK